MIPTGLSASGGGFEFNSGDKEQLLAVGLTTSELTNIQNDIAQYGIDQALQGSGLTSKQQSAIRNVMQGNKATETWSVTKDWLKKNFGDDILIKLARQKGYGSFWKSTSAEEDAYINDLVHTLNSQSGSGKSWDDVIKAEGLM
jgi:hypothetical protein